MNQSPLLWNSLKAERPYPQLRWPLSPFSSSRLGGRLFFRGWLRRRAGHFSVKARQQPLVQRRRVQHDPRFGNLLLRHLSHKSALCLICQVAAQPSPSMLCHAMLCPENTHQSFDDVLFNAFALREANSKVKLRGAVILLRGFPIPLRGFCVVLCQTVLAVFVGIAQSHLGSRVARERRFLAPLDSPVVRHMFG